MKDTRSPIWLDIETGGVEASKSSILSIASGQGKDIRSVFSAPVAGTFLSSFSEKQILPQLRGKNLLSEKQSIESLIQQLEVNPRTPIAGFNIRGFDIGFIQRRARAYGLEKRFTSTMRGREILDPIYQVKDIVASAISKHADVGTFSSVLEGKSWREAEQVWGELPFEQRPTEYNLIAQVKGYLRANSDRAKFKGWKLEDLHKLLPEEGLQGQAHEAATDIRMTQRVTQAARTGELEQELQKPARALQWIETVKARGYHQIGIPGESIEASVARGAGRLLTQADIQKMGLNVPRWWQTKPAKAAGLGIAAVLAASLFTGRDDEYNTIEGLPHGGFAQSGRLQLTDFGSGFRGSVSIGRGVAAIFGFRGGFQGSIAELQSTATMLRQLKTLNKKAELFADAELSVRLAFQAEFPGLNVKTVRKDLAHFLREMRKAKKAGHTSIIAIEKDFDWKATGLDLRATLYHERLHQKTSEWLRPATLRGGTDFEVFKDIIKDPSIVPYKHMAPEEAFVRTLEYIRSPKQYEEAHKVSPLLRARPPTKEEQEAALAIAKKWEIPISSRREGKFNRVKSSREETNTISGMSEQGQAAISRKLFGFGSPANTGMITGIAKKIMDIDRTTRRAERLYKSTIRSLLTEQGINKKDISFISNIADDQITLTAKHGDKELFYMRRSINNESIALDEIKLAKDLQGKGFGGQFYEYEERILKRLGLSGVETQSPTKNPLTARGQALRYGSKPHPVFDMPGLKTHLGVTDENDFLSKLVSGKYTLAEWEQKSIVPTMIGRVGQPKPRPIPSRNSADNTIDGMGHSGLAHRLRKLLTPFGSKWDALRNLTKGTETFEQMLASTGFQKALAGATELKQLGSGAMGTASLMKSSFRGKEFQFVRKSGALGYDEVSSMKALQNKFAPSVYSSSEKHVDMELFQGKTASELIKEGKLTPQHVEGIEEAARQMHKADISHGDFHAKNIIITPEGKVGAIDFGAAGPIGSSGRTRLANDQGQIVEGYYGGYTRVARKQHGKWTPEAIEIRDAEYDWGRIEQMKERMAKVQAQLQAPHGAATSIMPASVVTETATINENTFYAATKKVRHAALQRSATKTTWEAGKNGGKRSKL